MSERQKKRLAQREALKIKRRMIEKVRGSNFAFNLNLLVDGWLELESDPGTFSLLIEDFGCFGAQVDEIYDLEQEINGPVFGFIFLFKWINNQNDRSRNQKFSSTIASSTNTNCNNNNNNNNNNTSSTNNNETNNVNGEQSPNKTPQWTYVEDENIINKMFFAKQMISNSCATHALISILLNCDYHELNLGPILTRLKEHTRVMDSVNKGYAIGNLPELAKAHNSHASYSSLYNRDKPSSHLASGVSYIISGNQRTNLQQQKKHEAYHFVSYVPINNRLYELDGLKNYPIDHGPFDPKKENWTEKFRTVIKQRLLANKASDDSTVSNEIRYNLMAVVPDKRVRLRTEIKKLKSNLKTVQDTIQTLTKRVFPPPTTVDADIPNPPYSPISTGTLTASEAGSARNSPKRNEDDSPSDDDKKIDKFFFVKFTQQFQSTLAKEENTEQAHKNCIIDIESTNLEPIDLQIKNELASNSNKITLDDRLKMDTTTNDGDKNEVGDDKRNKNFNLSNNIDNNHCKTTNSHNSVFKSDTTNSVKDDLFKEKITPTRGNYITKNFKIINETKINGLIQKEEIVNIETNNTEAHKNEKYNLSTKPPFDFNILDEMQDVHFGKSTLKDLKVLSERISSEINRIESSLKEEIDKRRKYKIDNSRRTHNYEPFIMTFLSFLAKQGNLADLIEKDLGIISEDHHQVQPLAAQNSDPTSSSSSTISKTHKPSTSTTNNSGNNKLTTVNGSVNNRNSIASKTSITPKPRYKYVSTGRPVGRPRKNPLPETTPVKSTNNTK